MTAVLARCEPCGGTGTMPRVRRTLADGATPDPADMRPRELCPQCGGTGTVPDPKYPQPDRAERGGGWLADQIAVERKP